MTDKEWLAFYYFWKLQYESRWVIANNYAKISRKRKEITLICEEIKCNNLKLTLDEWFEQKGDLFERLNVPNFPCDKNNRTCKDCANCTQLVKKIKTLNKYSNLKNNLTKYSYIDDQLIQNSTKFLFDITVIKQQNSPEDLLLKHYVYEYPIKRNYINEGIKLLGIENLKLTEDNTLNGKVIAEIDLSCPSDFLNVRINSLKNMKFEKVPKFNKLYSKFKVEDIEDSKKEKKIIKEKPDLGFSITSFEARAFGLWLYDVLESNHYKGYAAAYSALKDGSWYCDKSKDAYGYEVAKETLSLLGKKDLDQRTIIRILNKTKECVKQCEVLNLK